MNTNRKGLQMNRATTLGLLSVLAMTTAACAGMDEAPRAPQPGKQIDAAQFYTGRWYEIARTPMKLTDGCAARVNSDTFLKAGSETMNQR